MADKIITSSLLSYFKGKLIELLDIDNTISTHNTNNTAHNDIRVLITGLTNRLNALADSDDTTLDQLSEIVTYIKNNKDLIEGVTTNKVNVSDIIDNLETTVTNKPLSANQGVELKKLIDEISILVTTGKTVVELVYGQEVEDYYLESIYNDYFDDKLIIIINHEHEYTTDIQFWIDDSTMIGTISANINGVVYELSQNADGVCTWSTSTEKTKLSEFENDTNFITLDQISEELVMAEYGVTVYADIEAAYAAEKTICLVKEVTTDSGTDYIYADLTKLENGAFVFTTSIRNTKYQFVCDETVGWSEAIYNIATKVSELENDSNLAACGDTTKVSSYPEPGLYDAEGNRTMTWDEMQEYSDNYAALPEGHTLVTSSSVYFGMNYEGQTASIDNIIIGDGTTSFSLTPFSWTSYTNKPLTLTIPTSVTTIETYLEDFAPFTIYYLGTEEQWNAIQMSDRDYFNELGITVVFNHTLGDYYSYGTLKDNTSSDFYPKTKASVVEMSDGSTVEEKLNNYVQNTQIAGDSLGLVKNGGNVIINNDGTMTAPTSEQVQPDYNQNDETASDFIKNRTHYESTSVQEVYINIEEGVGTILDNLTEEVNWYNYFKLTDVAPQKEDIVGTQYIYLDGIAWEQITGTFTSATDIVEGTMYQLNNDHCTVYVVLEDTTYLDVVWTKGIWSYSDDAMGSYVCGLNFTSEVTTIKKIDEKYIPDTIAKKSEIPTVPTKVSELENDAKYSSIKCITLSSKTWKTTTYGYEIFGDVVSAFTAGELKISLDLEGGYSDTIEITHCYCNNNTIYTILYTDWDGYRYSISGAREGNSINGWVKKPLSNGYFTSKRDFENGTLITTNIDYSVDGGESWLLELKGNSYVNQYPFDLKLQGYIYMDENNTAGMINYGGISNGYFFDDIFAFCYNSQLCFWFPRINYWQGFDVRVTKLNVEVRENPNCVISITDEAKPTDITKEISFSGLITDSITSSNVYNQRVGNSDNATYASFSYNDSLGRNIIDTYVTKSDITAIEYGVSSYSDIQSMYDKNNGIRVKKEEIISSTFIPGIYNSDGSLYMSWGDLVNQDYTTVSDGNISFFCNDGEYTCPGGAFTGMTFVVDSSITYLTEQSVACGCTLASLGFSKIVIPESTTFDDYIFGNYSIDTIYYSGSSTVNDSATVKAYSEASELNIQANTESCEIFANLSKKTSTSFVFTAIDMNGVYQMTCDSTNGWSYESNTLAAALLGGEW